MIHIKTGIIFNFLVARIVKFYYIDSECTALEIICCITLQLVFNLWWNSNQLWNPVNESNYILILLDYFRERVKESHLIKNHSAFYEDIMFLFPRKNIKMVRHSKFITRDYEVAYNFDFSFCWFNCRILISLVFGWKIECYDYLRNRNL